MTTKIEQSWQLFKASMAVTLKHRKLLWFPVLTTALTACIALFFLSAMALPVVLHHTGYHMNQKEHWVALKNYYLPEPVVKPGAKQDQGSADALKILLTGHAYGSEQPGRPAVTRGFPYGSILMIALYFLSMFLATFFNVAFYSEIISALNGRGVSFQRGLGVARSRLASILAWSLLAGLVGWIIRRLEERLPLAGRIVAGLIGIGWSIAAVFAIPVIIQEEPRRNPIKILQQSALTLKRTWGEGVIGYIGFSAGSTIVFLCSLVPLALFGALALVFKSGGIMVFGLVVWFLALLCVAYVSNVAGHVYRCALYLYAAEGVIPDPYSQNLLDMAWKVKKA